MNYRGSNAYDTNKGSTIPQLIGGSYTEGDEDVVKTLITIGITEIEQQLLQEQTVLVFPEDELDSKLKSMEVFGINFNSSEASWDVKVLVRTAANNIGIINL